LGFDLSLAAGVSGSATPEVALTFFLRPVSGIYDLPEGQWRLQIRTNMSATFTAGSASVAPGYVPNPGHPGTGTVVATYC
jgi:hypothetical protein